MRLAVFSLATLGFTLLSLGSNSCAPVSADEAPCEFCGHTDQLHGSFRARASWLSESEFEPEILAALAREGIPRGSVETLQLCPRAFGELPPAGSVRVLAPVETERDTDEVSWTWTILSRQAWKYSTQRIGLAALYGSASSGEFFAGEDHVWFLTLTVKGQEQEAGYVVRFEQEFRPANGRVTSRVAQSELAPEGQRLDTLVAVNDAELQLAEGSSAILATVDGNVIRLELSEDGELHEPALRQPWEERIRERIRDPRQDLILFHDEG